MGEKTYIDYGDLKDSDLFEDSKSQTLAGLSLVSNTFKDVKYHIDNINRKPSKNAKGVWKGAKTSKKHKTASASAEAGVGIAKASVSICEAKATGPYASAGAKAGAMALGAEASAQAHVGYAHAKASIFKAHAKALSVGASAGIGANKVSGLVGIGVGIELTAVELGVAAGPIGVKVGLSADTKASVGLSGVKLKVLGTGFSLDFHNGFDLSILGNGIGIKW